MKKLEFAGKYEVPHRNAHQYDEEGQWLRIVGDANPTKAMILIFIQKLCAAFHELGPACEMEAIKSEEIDYIKARLGARTEAVLERLRLNGIGKISGAAELAGMLDRLKSASSPAQIILMSEEVHLINHTLCDALEVL